VRHATTFAVAICIGIAMAWLVGCAPTTHVTETTTTRQYDTTTPPVANEKTTTTTRYVNGTVQPTSTQPFPDAPQDQTTTSVITDPNDGTIQKQTTTSYTEPDSTP
jgi:hypothetical protein